MDSDKFKNDLMIGETSSIEFRKLRGQTPRKPDFSGLS